MDHTPGQRQFRDLDKYFIYYQGKTGKSEQRARRSRARAPAVGRERAEPIGRASSPSLTPTA